MFDLAQYVTDTLTAYGHMKDGEITVAPPESFDDSTTVRFRVERGALARMVDEIATSLGYETSVLSPRDTWHGRWAVVASKD